MRRVAAFIHLSRFYFLPMPMLTYLIGVAVAERERAALNTQRLVAGLAIELLVQLSVSYTNDYWDIPTDRINTRRTLLSGGSGELITGLLPPWIALAAAAICQGTALLLAIWTGLPAISWALLVSALGAAVFYTTPPLKLAWHGLGEFTTALVGTLIVPAWAYSLQMGRVSGEIVLLTAPLLPFVMTIFLAIATPDIEADRQVDKRTLAVRVGEDRIAALYAGLLALAYSAAVIIWQERLPPSALVTVLLSVPLGVWAWHGLRTPIPEDRLGLTLMVLRAALIPLIVVVTLNLSLRAA
jgi:1,4-dihydroxy-2-naphthoate octaprenyltransferase